MVNYLKLCAARFSVGLPSLVAGGLVLVAGCILFWFEPSQHAFYPSCWFHRATGLLCPGCGSLRALHQLLHGNLVAAFRFNAFLMVCLPVVVWWALPRPSMEQSKGKPSRRIRPFWVWVFLATALAFGILRNLPGAPFDALRP